MYKIIHSAYLIAFLWVCVSMVQSVMIEYSTANDLDQGSDTQSNMKTLSKCNQKINPKIGDYESNDDGCIENETGSIKYKVSFDRIETLNGTYMIDKELSLTNTTSEKDYLIEWKPNLNTQSNNQGIEQLGIHDELVKNHYRVHNEYTPHYDTYIKRQYDIELTKIIEAKSGKMVKRKENNNFENIALKPIEEYKGATKYYSELIKNQPKDFKIKTYPEELDFGDVEICTQLTKELIVTNLKLKGNSGKNVEISDITAESPMVKIQSNMVYPIMVRPGNSISFTVTVLPELVEPIKTVIILKTRNFYKFMVLAKFNGINNEYNIHPIVATKPYRLPPYINFAIKNNESTNELNLTLSNAFIENSTNIGIYQITNK